jgi:hypothetical protein
MFLRSRVTGGLLLVVALTAAVRPAFAQLRPYEPFDWSVLEGSNTVSGLIGAASLWGQRASLAGTDGHLTEFGAFQVFARTGRVVLEAGGTLLRVFEEQAAFAPPTGGAVDHELGTRRDAGDYRVSTTVVLFEIRSQGAAIVRFGSRLPTTDNRVGLERDAFDFFALLGGRLDSSWFRATAELGIGIHGTRLPEFEQSDVLVYILGLAPRFGAVRPTLLLLGQADALDFPIRGNEKLSEARLRVRGGDRVWVQVEGIKGLTEASPTYGVSLALGLTR